MSDAHLPLTVHQLVFEGEVRTPIEFGPQAGAQLRGALWEALREVVLCDDAQAGTPEHSRFCPICRLIMMESDNSPRGVNPPRPFALRPPLDFDDNLRIKYKNGETIRFGVNLYGDAERLFPYVCQAVYKIGEIGVGYGRVRFLLRRAMAVNPFTGQNQVLFDEARLRSLPGLPITHEVIDTVVKMWPKQSIGLRWLTPCELTEHKKPVSTPHMPVVIARLLERAQLLEMHYTDTPQSTTLWRERHLALQAVAQKVNISVNNTRWVHVMSGSRRAEALKPVSGLVGQVRYTGNLAPLLYWLAWGSVLHIGKNVVKGNGWYSFLPLEQ